MPTCGRLSAQIGAVQAFRQLAGQAFGRSGVQAFDASSAPPTGPQAGRARDTRPGGGKVPLVAVVITTNSDERFFCRTGFDE